ncbi:MAG: hypothetical protein WA081_17475 [Desulfosalsimonadaceae bacterium]
MPEHGHDPYKRGASFNFPGCPKIFFLFADKRRRERSGCFLLQYEIAFCMKLAFQVLKNAINGKKKRVGYLCGVAFKPPNIAGQMVGRQAVYLNGQLFRCHAPKKFSPYFYSFPGGFDFCFRQNTLIFYWLVFVESSPPWRIGIKQLQHEI